MGSVYLARQVALDRHVALKVMHPSIARNPTFLARFLREAIAAGQLVHPHVVQIYDIGDDRGVRYFSMEFVRGSSLGDLLRTKGAFDPLTAARYILQAARGLQYAHDRGIIHRDIKPDNLLLDQLGIIKIADLGLAKVPVAAAGSEAAELTATGTTVGTAAYMAPEQARASSAADHRADIYSLGCTFYALLARRPPFTGTTSLELMTRHCTEPVPPLEKFVPDVPPALVAIVNRMLAKSPGERYPTCKQLIADLKRFLDRASGKDAFPSVEHVARLHECVERFQTPTARARGLILLGCLGAALAFALLLLTLRQPLMSATVAGLTVLTALVRMLINGIVYHGPLMSNLRELLLSGRPRDWLYLGLGIVLVGLVLYFTDTMIGAAALLGGAVACALVLHWALDRRVAAERRQVLEDVLQLLATLREGGLDEEAVHRFVFDHGGEHWEELFEALFGYAWLVHARREWGKAEGVAQRPRHAAWRDPLIRWMHAWIQARRRRRELAMLARAGANQDELLETTAYKPLAE
jgi:hypothetical protein